MAEPGPTLRADGGWWVTAADGRRMVAYAVTDTSGTTWVHVEGEVVLVAPAERVRSRGPASGAADLEAPMPAQVIAVLVSPGDCVAAGTPLVLLEAMKMELPLRAPAPGRVAAVHCAPGDRVGPGRPLVDIEPLGGQA